MSNRQPDPQDPSTRRRIMKTVAVIAAVAAVLYLVTLTGVLRG